MLCFHDTAHMTKNNKLTNMMALYNVIAVLQIIGCVETNYRNDNNRYLQEFHYAKKIFLDMNSINILDMR